MRIETDFTKISSQTGALEAGEYQCVLTDIEEGETKENKLPQVIFTFEVNDPNHPIHTGHPVRQYITLKTKKNEPNKMGLGQIKAVAEAVLGDEAANNPEGIDLDDLKNGSVMLVIGIRSYNKKNQDGSDSGEQGTTNEIVKVLPVS